MICTCICLYSLTMCTTRNRLMLCFLDGVTDSYGVNATLMLSQCRRWQAAGAMTPNLTTDRLLSYVL